MSLSRSLNRMKKKTSIRHRSVSKQKFRGTKRKRIVSIKQTRLNQDYNDSESEDSGDDATVATDPVLDYLHARTAVSPSKLRLALNRSTTPSLSSSPSPSSSSSNSATQPSSSFATPHKIHHGNGEYSVTFIERSIGMNFKANVYASDTAPGYAINEVLPNTPASASNIQPQDRLLALSTLCARDMTVDDVCDFIGYSARPLTLRFLEKDTKIHTYSPKSSNPQINTRSGHFNPRHLDAATRNRASHPVTPSREYLHELKERESKRTKHHAMDSHTYGENTTANNANNINGNIHVSVNVTTSTNTNTNANTNVNTNVDVDTKTNTATVTNKTSTRSDTKKKTKNKNKKTSSSSIQEPENWIQCEHVTCMKWRKIPMGVNVDTLPEPWYCSMNQWDSSQCTCNAIEDTWDPTTTTSTSTSSTSTSLNQSSSQYIKSTTNHLNLNLNVDYSSLKITPAIALVATTQKAARNGLVVKKKKKTIRAKKPKVACPYCGELKKTRSNGSSKGSWLRECMNTECDARFYRVDPITHKASVLENGHRGPVKHVIKVMKD